MGERKLTSEQKARLNYLVSELCEELNEPKATDLSQESCGRVTVSSLIDDAISHERIGRLVFEICDIYYGFSYPFVDFEFYYEPSNKSAAEYCESTQIVRSNFRAIKQLSKLNWVKAYFHEFRHKIQGERGAEELAKPSLYDNYQDREDSSANAGSGYLWYAEKKELDAELFALAWVKKIISRLTGERSEEIRFEIDPLQEQFKMVYKHLRGNLKLAVRLAQKKAKKDEYASRGFARISRLAESILSGRQQLTFLTDDCELYSVPSGEIEYVINSAYKRGISVANALNNYITINEHKTKDEVGYILELSKLTELITDDIDRVSTEEYTKRTLMAYFFREYYSGKKSPCNYVDGVEITSKDLFRLQQMLTRGEIEESSADLFWGYSLEDTIEEYKKIIEEQGAEDSDLASGQRA